MRRALVVLCLVAMSIFLANCGQSFDLQSITVSPDATNLEGVGATRTFTVTAHFSNTKSEDVTAHSTFVLGPSLLGFPPSGMTLNHNVLQVVDGVCTWDAEPTNAADTTFSYSTDPFVLTATFTDNGITKTSQSFVSVDSLAGCYDGQAYPAPAGFTGTRNQLF